MAVIDSALGAKSHTLASGHRIAASLARGQTGDVADLADYFAVGATYNMPLARTGAEMHIRWVDGALGNKVKFRGYVWIAPTFMVYHRRRLKADRNVCASFPLLAHKVSHVHFLQRTPTTASFL